MKTRFTALALVLGTMSLAVQAAAEAPRETREQRTQAETETPWAANPDLDRVCHHRGDRRGFELCTELDPAHCKTLANGTVICEPPR